jgi:hypothetical protein
MPALLAVTVWGSMTGWPCVMILSLAHNWEAGVRCRRVSRVHLPCERQSGSGLHPHCGRRRGKEGHHDRGPGSPRRAAPVQQVWLDEDVAQCGFCQPGQIMQAAALLSSKRSPSDADIDQIMNVCRCGTYCRIRKAIKSARRSCEPGTPLADWAVRGRAASHNITLAEALDITRFEVYVGYLDEGLDHQGSQAAARRSR